MFVECLWNACWNACGMLVECLLYPRNACCNVCGMLVVMFGSMCLWNDCTNACFNVQCLHQCLHQCHLPMYIRVQPHIDHCYLTIVICCIQQSARCRQGLPFWRLPIRLVVRWNVYRVVNPV
jgi:hypothetical protein